MTLPPQVVAIGVDIVEVERISAALERRGEAFLRRIYTPLEQAWGRDTANWHQHLAARFAAKEAVSKALGTGIGSVRWLDIEVRREAGQRPRVHLTGRAAERARELGIDRWHLSLSHTRKLAVAQVVAEGPGRPEEPEEMEEGPAHEPPGPAAER